MAAMTAALYKCQGLIQTLDVSEFHNVRFPFFPASAISESVPYDPWQQFCLHHLLSFKGTKTTPEFPYKKRVYKETTFHLEGELGTYLEGGLGTYLEVALTQPKRLSA